MSKSPVINPTSKCGACGLIGLALLAGQARGQSDYDPGWTKNFRVGAMTGLGIKGQIKLRGSFAVNSSDPSAGIFDDGYVHPDATGNANYTSFWGYESASQYDAGTHTLQMHSASSFTANGNSSLDQDFSVGVELAYGNNLKQWGRTRLGWEFGFGYLPVSLKSSRSTSIPGSVTRATYNFSTGTIIPPDPGYHGGSSGEGPNINPNIISSSSTTTNGTISDLGNLDAALYTFRLGPTLFYDLSERFGISAGIGPAVGILSEECKFNELITFGDGTTARARGHFGTTDIVYGGYVNLVGTFHVEPNGDLYLSVQYMPMSGSTFSKGGRQASVDLSGQVYISLGINWIF